MKRSLFLHTLVGTMLVGALTSCSRAAQPEAEQATHRPLTEQVRGTVVYEHKGGIYKTELGKKEAVRLADKGSWPRWSPDGRYVTFVRGKDIARVSADGGDVEILAPVEKPRAVAYHPNGQEVLYTDGDHIFAASVDDSQIRAVLDGYLFRELDVTADGKTLVATVKRHGYSITLLILRRATRGRWRGAVPRACRRTENSFRITGGGIARCTCAT